VALVYQPTRRTLARGAVRDILATGGRALLLSIVANVFLGIWPAAELMLVQAIVNAVASNHRGLDYVGLLFGVGLCVSAVFVLHPIAGQRAKQGIYAALMDRFLRSVANARAEVHLDPVVKDRMTNSHDSILAIERTVLDNGVQFVQLAAAVVALGALLSTIVLWAPLVLLFAATVQLGVAQHTGRQLEGQLTSTAEPRRVMDTWSHLIATPSSAREIRSPGVLPWVLRHWEDAYRRASGIELKTKAMSAKWEMLGNVVGGGSVLLILLDGIERLSQHQVSPGGVAILLGASLYLDQFLQMVLLQGRQWIGRSRFLAGGEWVSEPSEVRQVPEPTATAGIVLQNVSYTYPRGSAAALIDVSLEIAAGTKLAVVGPNGSGKTTLAKLLLGLLTPTAGDLQRTSAVGASFQDFGRYELSVRENVVLGDIGHADDEVGISRLLRDLAPFVSEFPDGPMTALGPELGGRNLSEGQWQALAMARGVFRSLHCQSGLVVLDEPTAALDPGAELAMLGGAMRLLAPFTVLFVVHRLVGCVFADKILVLDAGRVVGYGPHTELLTSCSLYRTMWDSSSSFLRKGLATSGKDTPLA
jgi:ATP-binding cassette subfamily B protein